MLNKKNSSSGHVLEEMVLTALVQGGYTPTKQVNIGLRPSGGTHKVDLVAKNRRDEFFLISLKWQQTSGTAEQKVPFEVICLKDAILKSNNKYQRAYLVLGGNGWTMKRFYTSGELDEYLPHKEQVMILGFEDFVARANNGNL
jgi:hypothetical protein